MLIKGYVRFAAGVAITGCWATTQAAPVAPAPVAPAPATAPRPSELAPVAVTARASAAVSAAVPRSAATIASHAADAMRNGCAHVEPKFLSGDERLPHATRNAARYHVRDAAGDRPTLQDDVLEPEHARRRQQQGV